MQGIIITNMTYFSIPKNIKLAITPINPNIVLFLEVTFDFKESNSII